MRADNSRHLTKAARSRAEHTRRRAVTTLRQLTRAGQPLTVSVLAQRAGVSRSWLYTQADLLAQIREETPRSARATTVPARQAASDGSLRQRLQLAHARIRDLEADNERLRHALAQALGDQRARHARDPLESRAESTRPKTLPEPSPRTRPPHKTTGQSPSLDQGSR